MGAAALSHFLPLLTLCCLTPPPSPILPAPPRASPRLPPHLFIFSAFSPFTASGPPLRICFPLPLFKDALLQLPHTQLNHSHPPAPPPPAPLLFILMQIPNIVPAYVNSLQLCACACVHTFCLGTLPPTAHTCLCVFP